MKKDEKKDMLSQVPTVECMCPNCGFRVPHYLGVPCYKQSCPRCGSKMTEVNDEILRY